MLEAINTFLHSHILASLGLFIAVVFLGSKIFTRLGIPQVVGFIAIGVLHGPSFLNAVPLDLIDQLTFVSEIALGLIGFDMGGHLLLRDLRKLGRCITTILIFEALGTFALVTLGIYALTGIWHTALIFGALSSATAPAATVDVLAEYDAQGPLTTSLIAVVGLDDAISLLLYSIAAALTEAILTGAHISVPLQILEIPLIEIGGSVLLGLGLGVGLKVILDWMKSRHDAMAISIGFVFLAVGLSEALSFSMILTTMVLGTVLVNISEEHGRYIRYTIEQAGPVIYVLFFGLVGARFQIQLLPVMGVIGVAYVIFRSLGKFSGAWVGGKLGGAPPLVRDNLGFGLLSQAGVAIGLALASAGRFSRLGPEGVALGALIINVITATTFIVQMIGPIFVKHAIQRAGEIGQAKLGPEVWASEGKPK
jgi:Kef-type K+ transport system membrane component KefB